MEIDRFRFIIKAKKVPIVDNPIIKYIEDSGKNRLYCEIYYDDNLISKGIILDFYKEFENVELEEKYTHILTFEWKDKTYTKIHILDRWFLK